MVGKLGVRASRRRLLARGRLSFLLFRLGELVAQLLVFAGEAIDLLFQRQRVVGDGLTGPMVELLPAYRHRASRACPSCQTLPSTVVMV